jgi:hypothetical protein
MEPALLKYALKLLNYDIARHKQSTAFEVRPPSGQFYTMRHPKFGRRECTTAATELKDRVYYYSNFSIAAVPVKQAAAVVI